MTLQLDAIGKRFAAAGPLVLDRVSCTIPTGSLTAVLGPSGAGKSTLLHIVAGLQTADTGSVRLDGRRLDGVAAHRRPLTMLLQRPNLFEHLDVVDNVAFGLRVRGRRRAPRRAAAVEQLRLVGIEHLAHRWPRQLSGGEAQRVALARALAVGPSVLLADEPFASVDVPTRRELQDLLGRLHRDLSMTVLLVTHDVEEALSLSDQLIVLAGGRIVDEGEPTRLHRRPRTTAAAELLGMVNRWSGIVHGGCLHVGPRPLLLDPARALAPITAPRPSCWAIRPEDVSIGASGPNVWRGAVSARRFLGHEVEVHVAVGELTVVARSPAADRIELGDELSLALPPDALVELEVI